MDVFVGKISNMKKRFLPRVFFPTIQFLAILFFLFIHLVIIYLSPKDNANDYFGFIFINILWGSFTFNIAYFFCFYFKYVTIEDNTLSIFELKNLKTIRINFEDILGYAKSEIHFGRPTWKSNTIVIYLKNKKVCEISNAYIRNIDSIEKELQLKKVKYLGFESYYTGWFFRKYLFQKG